MTGRSEYEVCEALGIDSRRLHEWIAAGLVEPRREADAVFFTADQVRRLWSIVSLQRDLDVNLAGVSAILDLSNQVRQLQAALWQAEQRLRSADRIQHFQCEVLETHLGPADWEIDL